MDSLDNTEGATLCVLWFSKSQKPRGNRLLQEATCHPHEQQSGQQQCLPHRGPKPGMLALRTAISCLDPSRQSEFYFTVSTPRHIHTLPEGCLGFPTGAWWFSTTRTSSVNLHVLIAHLILMQVKRCWACLTFSFVGSLWPFMTPYNGKQQPQASGGGD